MSNAKSPNKKPILQTKKFFENQRGNFQISLCDENCENNRVGWDRGWGCSYRCIQNVFSVLIAMEPYREALKMIQNYAQIVDIQSDIEKAWRIHRIDVEGGHTFGFELIGKHDWIGATEVAALLRSKGIRAHVHDFILSNPKGSAGHHTKLADLVEAYFAADRGPPPLYLQMAGHSLTIVGIHKDLSTGLRSLILFDSAERAQMQPILKPETALTDRCYQIVQVDGLMEGAEECLKAQTIRGLVNFG